MEGKKTPEEYLTEEFQIVVNGLEYIPKEDAQEAVSLTRQENQDKLKEIRDKVGGLDSYVVPLILSEVVCVPLNEVLEILNQYIDGK